MGFWNGMCHHTMWLLLVLQIQNDDKCAVLAASNRLPQGVVSRHPRHLQGQHPQDRSTAAITQQRYHPSAVTKGDQYKSITRGYNGSDLPAWENHTQSLPVCAAVHLREQQVRVGLPVKWYRTHDGDFHVEPEGCKLRRPDAVGIRKCLSNRTIHFFGDSVMRYQYIDLVYMLGHGHYMPRYGPLSDADKCLVNHSQWPDWQPWYKDLISELTSGTDAKIEGGCDCEHGGSEVYDLEFQHESGRTATKMFFPSKDTDAIIKQLNKSIIEDKAGIIVVNLGYWIRGWHGISNDSNVVMEALAYVEPLLRYGNTLRAKHNPSAVLVWRSQTRWYSPPDQVDGSQPLHTRREHDPKLWFLHHFDVVFRETAQLWGWHVVDVFSVSQQALAQGLVWHWDALHYHAGMYQEFNDVLLNTVCD